VLRVRDNGRGSRSNATTRLRPLRAGEGTLDRAECGLGIGLTVVQKLVELHGAVAAFSEGPDGSRVCAPAGQPPLRRREVSATADSSVGRARVLVGGGQRRRGGQPRHDLEVFGHAVQITPRRGRGIGRVRRAPRHRASTSAFRAWTVRRRPAHPASSDDDACARALTATARRGQDALARGFDQHLVSRSIRHAGAGSWPTGDDARDRPGPAPCTEPVGRAAARLGDRAARGTRRRPWCSSHLRKPSAHELRADLEVSQMLSKENSTPAVPRLEHSCASSNRWRAPGPRARNSAGSRRWRLETASMRRRSRSPARRLRTVRRTGREHTSGELQPHEGSRQRIRFRCRARSCGPGMAPRPRAGRPPPAARHCSGDEYGPRRPGAPRERASGAAPGSRRPRRRRPRRRGRRNARKSSRLRVVARMVHGSLPPVSRRSCVTTDAFACPWAWPPPGPPPRPRAG